MIETGISGEEYSCAVLEYPDGKLRTMPPILIRPVSSSFFDYTAKYTPEACEEIVPAPCSSQLKEQIQKSALLAHKALQCSGLTRTDMIYDGTTLSVLEINTLPGLTPASLVPKAFAAMDGTYSQLLDIIIQTALGGR